ncbi:N-myc-interactor [Halichoeres trimaculatus]|uniref:N-myc-interactor n=1 Tax=Halichoeres trimaculatus TaxID=147232 RepID=UPI003D9DE785
MLQQSDPIMSDMMKNGEMQHRELEEAKAELETWKNRIREADDMKAKLTLEKLNEDEVKTTAQNEMMALSKQREELKNKFTESLMEVQEEIKSMRKRKHDLIDKLNKSQEKLQRKRNECTKLQQKFKIYAQIPDSKVEFSDKNVKQVDEDDEQIRAEFVISQRVSAPLEGGQALITFEEERVAAQILKVGKFSVSCESEILDVKAKKINLDPTVKFEVHLQVSRKQLGVSEVPPSLPEESMKDRLMISFCRPSRGGGEVKEVKYDKKTGKASITFLEPGVADSLVLKGDYLVDLDSEVKVQVEPVYKYELQKFQTFCGSSRRTVLLEGISDVVDQEDLQDSLEIHFQKPRNHGGEIESIEYVSRKRGQVTAFFNCEEEEMPK